MKKKKSEPVPKSEVQAQKEAQQAQRKEEQARKKAAKAEARAFEAAQRAERSKEPDTAYVMRKNTVFLVLRTVLWIALAFIFLRGVAVSLRPDPVTEVNKTIDDFKMDFVGYQEQDNEVLAFAQNFAVNYLTYTAGAEADYISRLEQYAAKTVTGQGNRFPSGAAATVIYAQAYRKEAYSPTQVDVWVLLTVEYRSKQQSTDGIVSEQTATETAVLKVPVSMVDSRYMVEDVPVFVADSNRQAEYKTAAFKGGGECDRATTEGITQALTMFYKAYYMDEQSAINYYLAPNADLTDFVGLGGRLTFDKITSLRAVYLQEGVTNQFVAVLTVQVTDRNGAAMLQNYNVQLVYRDGQYYVQSMDTRNFNLYKDGGNLA